MPINYAHVWSRKYGYWKASGSRPAGSKLFRKSREGKL